MAFDRCLIKDYLLTYLQKSKSEVILPRLSLSRNFGPELSEAGMKSDSSICQNDFTLFRSSEPLSPHRVTDDTNYYYHDVVFGVNVNKLSVAVDKRQCRHSPSDKRAEGFNQRRFWRGLDNATTPTIISHIISIHTSHRAYLITASFSI